MRMRNIKAEPVKACCSFYYLGFLISASTIVRPTSILVYDGDDVIYDAVTIEEAIKWIEAEI